MAMVGGDGRVTGAHDRAVGRMSQAVNLALMLGVEGCSYFEQPVPVEHFDYAAADPIRIDREGSVTLPDRPGLGLEIQAARIEADAFTMLDSGSLQNSDL